MLNDKCPICNQTDGHHKHCSIGILVSFINAEKAERHKYAEPTEELKTEEEVAQGELDKLDAHLLKSTESDTP